MDDTTSTEIEHLKTAQCWRLLEESSIGRLAVQGAEGVPDIFPVNFTVHSGSVYIRSAPGAKLMDIADRPGVAFEVDGQDGVSFWSVVIKGTARRLDSDEEIHESGVENLVSASPTSKQNFIGITAVVDHRAPLPQARIRACCGPPTTPRRTPRRAHTSRSGRSRSTASGPARATAAAGPIPIPHFPPPPSR